MAGWIKHFGFAIPISIALGIGANGPRDDHPSPGMCVLCKKFSKETYERGDLGRVCLADIVDTVKVIRRVPVQRRPPDHPVEVVNGLVDLDPWWDRQFA